MIKRHSSSSIRWPADLKAEITKRAQDEARSFSNYVIQVMRQHIVDTKRKSRT